MDPQLRSAIEQGNAEEVDRLLAARPDVSDQAQEGVSTVLFALYRRQEEIGRRLAGARGRPLDAFEAAALGEAGRLAEVLAADPGAVDRRAVDGFTPLSLACYFGRTATVRLLLEQGAAADLPAANRSGVRPLHSAVAHEDLPRARAIAALLLAAGADPNVEQEGGWTPLHAAALHGDRELVELLLDHGAEPGVASVDGKTPADLARAAGHQAIVEILTR